MKLHLGCGKRNFGKDWIHIDASKYDHIQSHDVTKLPYNDNTVDLIYNCGIIAYFNNEEIKPILQEWKRVLKKGGILRISTANFKPICKLYLEDKYPIEKFIGPIFGKWNTYGNNFVY